jgi:hypothetical protein
MRHYQARREDKFHPSRPLSLPVAKCIERSTAS